MTKKKEQFEELLARLETIVTTMEGGGLGLEESMALYEEGVKKAETLAAMLAEARERVMKLVAANDGSPVLEPFEGNGQA